MGQDSGIDQVINTAVQTISLGGVKYKGDGKFSADIKDAVPFRALDEGVGEVTGRNAMRKDIMNKADAVAEEKAAKKQQQIDEQTRRQQNDVRASRQVGALRATAQAKKNLSLGTPNLGQDFLGL